VHPHLSVAVVGAEALNRPALAAIATGSVAETNPYSAGYKGSQTGTGVLNGKYPLFNHGNTANIERARRMRRIGNSALPDYLWASAGGFERLTRVAHRVGRA
jgi:hypothetical protein